MSEQIEKARRKAIKDLRDKLWSEFGIDPDTELMTDREAATHNVIAEFAPHMVSIHQDKIVVADLDDTAMTRFQDEVGDECDCNAADGEGCTNSDCEEVDVTFAQCIGDEIDVRIGALGVANYGYLRRLANAAN